MKYYEFQYWPFKNDGSISESWQLIEMPRDWAEEEVDKVVSCRYYDNHFLTWYNVEVEAESPAEAFEHAWNLVVIAAIQKIPLAINEYYHVGCLQALDRDGTKEEIDWTVRPILESELEYGLNVVSQVNDSYEVEVKTSSLVEAFKLADSLIQEKL